METKAISTRTWVFKKAKTFIGGFDFSQTCNCWCCLWWLLLKPVPSEMRLLIGQSVFRSWHVFICIEICFKTPFCLYIFFLNARKQNCLPYDAIIHSVWKVLPFILKILLSLRPWPCQPPCRRHHLVRRPCSTSPRSTVQVFSSTGRRVPAVYLTWLRHWPTEPKSTGSTPKTTREHRSSWQCGG